ncbi:MAG: hypothetical protein ACI9TY_000275 [Alphaproteobacteria bacterium]|jgi:hypothetical protein
MNNFTNFVFFTLKMLTAIYVLIVAPAMFFFFGLDLKSLSLIFIALGMSMLVVALLAPSLNLVMNNKIQKA